MFTRRNVLAGCVALPLSTHWLQAQHHDATPASRLLAAAKSQIGVTRRYNPAYVALDYPGGDVPIESGVCTDVVVRAYRAGLGFDLQLAVHEDMSSAFSAYPDNWGLSRPDHHIDHRRVPNLETYLARQNAELDVGSDWQPGDLMTGRLRANGLPHIAIVSSLRARLSRRPLLVHNIGRGTEISDDMPLFDQLRRFRYFPSANMTT